MKRASSASAIWARLAAFYALHGYVLLLCGGDWKWWQGWAYSLLFGSAGIGLRVWAERSHPGLMAERAQLLRAPGVKSWDRLLAPLMALSLGLPVFIVAGLDHRFGWSPGFPSWLNILGLVLAAAGYGFAGSSRGTGIRRPRPLPLDPGDLLIDRPTLGARPLSRIPRAA